MTLTDRTRWGFVVVTLLTACAAATDDDAARARAGDDAAGGDAGTKASSDAAGADGGITSVHPPGGPGCGFASAAFCDTFDAKAGNRGRAGDLDSASWSVGRMAPQGPTPGDEAFGVSASTLRPMRSGSQLPACRPELGNQVFPGDDTLICDSSADIGSSHLLVATASQNYGQNSYRIRQPFDFAGRTGKIAFDAEAFVADALLGWISLDVTEDPVAVPSFVSGGRVNFEGGSIPRNGFEVQLFSGCHVPNTLTVSEVHVFDGYVDTTLATPDGTPCVATAWGKLNHFEVLVSEQKIEIFGSEVSTDGVTFAKPTLLYAADVHLPFSRGYVHLTTHNHASLKYTNEENLGFLHLDSWITRWDNVGFDGPVILDTREYDVAETLTHGQFQLHNGLEQIEGVNTGWQVTDSSSTSLTFKGVDPSNATSAKISLSAWYCLGCGGPPASYTWKYRLNGHAWHERVLTAGEAAVLAGGTAQGALDELLDVPPGELVSGDNTFELQAANIPQQYKPGVTNVTLVLQTPPR